MLGLPCEEALIILRGIRFTNEACVHPQEAATKLAALQQRLAEPLGVVRIVFTDQSQVEEQGFTGSYPHMTKAERRTIRAEILMMLEDYTNALNQHVEGVSLLPVKDDENAHKERLALFASVLHLTVSVFCACEDWAVPTNQRTADEDDIWSELLDLINKWLPTTGLTSAPLANPQVSVALSICSLLFSPYFATAVGVVRGLCRFDTNHVLSYVVAALEFAAATDVTESSHTTSTESPSLLGVSTYESTAMHFAMKLLSRKPFLSRIKPNLNTLPEWKKIVGSVFLVHQPDTRFVSTVPRLVYNSDLPHDATGRITEALLYSPVAQPTATLRPSVADDLLYTTAQFLETLPLLLEDAEVIVMFAGRLLMAVANTMTQDFQQFLQGLEGASTASGDVQLPLRFATSRLSMFNNIFEIGTVDSDDDDDEAEGQQVWRKISVEVLSTTIQHVAEFLVQFVKQILEHPELLNAGEEEGKNTQGWHMMHALQRYLNYGCKVDSKLLDRMVNANMFPGGSVSPAILDMFLNLAATGGVQGGSCLAYLRDALEARFSDRFLANNNEPFHTAPVDTVAFIMTSYLLDEGAFNTIAAPALESLADCLEKSFFNDKLQEAQLVGCVRKAAVPLETLSNALSGIPQLIQVSLEDQLLSLEQLEKGVASCVAIGMKLVRILSELVGIASLEHSHQRRPSIFTQLPADTLVAMVKGATATLLLSRQLVPAVVNDSNRDTFAGYVDNLMAIAERVGVAAATMLEMVTLAEFHNHRTRPLPVALAAKQGSHAPSESDVRWPQQHTVSLGEHALRAAEETMSAFLILHQPGVGNDLRDKYASRMYGVEQRLQKAIMTADGNGVNPHFASSRHAVALVAHIVSIAIHRCTLSPAPATEHQLTSDQVWPFAITALKIATLDATKKGGDVHQLDDSQETNTERINTFLEDDIDSCENAIHLLGVLREAAATNCAGFYVTEDVRLRCMQLTSSAICKLQRYPALTTAAQYLARNVTVEDSIQDRLKYNTALEESLSVFNIVAFDALEMMEQDANTEALLRALFDLVDAIGRQWLVAPDAVDNVVVLDADVDVVSRANAIVCNTLVAGHKMNVMPSFLCEVATKFFRRCTASFLKVPPTEKTKQLRDDIAMCLKTPQACLEECIKLHGFGEKIGLLGDILAAINAFLE